MSTRSAVSAASQIERICSRNAIRFGVMSILLMSPLPAFGQTAEISVSNRDESLLAFDLKDIIPGIRIRKPRVPRTSPQRSIPSDAQTPTGDAQTPTPVPSTSSPRNRSPRQAPPSAPVSQQEQEYMNSLTPEQRQLYEIIQRAKRGLQHQRVANFLGSGFGLSPRGTYQTAQDLDREFQNALRSAGTSSAATDTKPGNQLLQRMLNKRSNETPEQWYARTSFLLYYTPGEEARQWRATLSPAQIQAYDALALKNRTEGMREVDGALKDAIRRELSCRQVQDSNGDYVRVCND
jgi:hypothetical protein